MQQKEHGGKQKMFDEKKKKFFETVALVQTLSAELKAKYTRKSVSLTFPDPLRPKMLEIRKWVSRVCGVCVFVFICFTHSFFLTAVGCVAGPLSSE